MSGSVRGGGGLTSGLHTPNTPNTRTHADLGKPLISCVFYLLSLHELVKHEENGLIFRDSQELAEQLRVRMLYIKKKKSNHSTNNTDESLRA